MTTAILVLHLIRCCGPLTFGRLLERVADIDPSATRQQVRDALQYLALSGLVAANIGPWPPELDVTRRGRRMHRKVLIQERKIERSYRRALSKARCGNVE